MPLVKAIAAPFLELRVADAVDILLVTALLYATVVWFRTSRASMVALGLLLFAAVFSAARFFGLQLTTWIFQGIFAALLIIVVVIFQEELRQIFERLALWGLRRKSAASTTPQAADLIVECLGNLARRRIGALIVIPGRGPLGRHVRGGLDLGGTLSIPLLESIFDPHSPGHDGAVILDGNRVTRFGVHLPLSANSEQLGGVGTRHSAALGLAERTDALCLVVSEERGSVAVARNGELRRLADAGDVAQVLLELREQPAPTKAPRFLARVRRLRWPELIGSLAAVLALWLVLVPGSRPSEIVVEAAIVVSDLPAGYDIESITPETIQVELRGPARAFYLFDANAVQITVDAALAELGRRTFQISENQVRRPAGVKVARLRPSKIRLSLVKQAEADSTDETSNPTSPE